ncbi:hypothetical protein Sjap_021977 [Stephania japonica]|uniref:Uncharacterized protein n=1 Tax=Stephania japonica TaxID=461633 RepID=A0AAP0HUL6_9MAGN
MNETEASSRGDTRSTHHDGRSTSPVVRSTPPSDRSTSTTTRSTSQYQMLNPFGNSLNRDRHNEIWIALIFDLKAMVLPLFRGCRLDGHLLGTIVCPPEILEETASNPEYEEWYARDQFCLGWLISAISKEVASAVVGAKNAREAWRNIEDHCGSYSRAQIQVYKRQIQSNKKGSRSISEYVLHMKELADNLAIAGAPMNKTQLEFIWVIGVCVYIFNRFGLRFVSIVKSNIFLIILFQN